MSLEKGLSESLIPMFKECLGRISLGPFQFIVSLLQPQSHLCNRSSKLVGWSSVGVAGIPEQGYHLPQSFCSRDADEVLICKAPCDSHFGLYLVVSALLVSGKDFCHMLSISDVAGEKHRSVDESLTIVRAFVRSGTATVEPRLEAIAMPAVSTGSVGECLLFGC